jgi:hypothetical protein
MMVRRMAPDPGASPASHLNYMTLLSVARSAILQPDVTSGSGKPALSAIMVVNQRAASKGQDGMGA